MVPSTITLAIGAAALAALGTPLRQDGFTIRPPEEFRKVRMELFLGTRTSTPAVDPSAQRFLATSLADGEGEDAAAMLIGVVEGSFAANPSSRDAFSAAAVRHFADELGIPLTLERAEVVGGDAPRVEVVGTLRQQDQLRRVLVAAMEGSGRHAVITVSMPVGRFEALLPRVRESLDTYRAETAPGAGVSRNLAGSVAAIVGLGLFFSWLAWRRRARFRRADRGLAP